MINARLRNVKYRALCLKNTAFGRSARVKTRKCQYSGNMALRASELDVARLSCKMHRARKFRSRNGQVWKLERARM